MSESPIEAPLKARKCIATRKVGDDQLQLWIEATGEGSSRQYRFELKSHCVPAGKCCVLEPEGKFGPSLDVAVNDGKAALELAATPVVV